MSITRTLVFFVLCVAASELATNIVALSEVPSHGHSTIQYVDNPVGSSPGVVTLPSVVHHAEDRSGLADAVSSPSVSTGDHPVDGGVHPPADPGTAGGHGGGHGEGIHVFTAEFARVEIPFIISLWIFCASLAKIGFHMAPKLSSIFPESCLLIVVGIVIGLLLFHTNSAGVSPLTPTTFFFYMLPPIILDAGYFMPNRLFFDHLGTILLFAVLGTIWNTVSIGLALWGVGQTGLYGFDLPLLDTFLFSALISAVDPVAVLAVFEEIHVNEILYIVVFGESLLNDAVTVVLYNMFDAYVGMGQENIKYTDILSGFASFIVVAIGGTLIGIIWGFLTGFVTRFTNHVRVIEPIFIFVMSYLAYLNAEIFHMSGILAITFCGITMKNYVEGNISPKSHTTIKYAMKMLSSSSETIIFMFLGVNTVNDQHDWNTAFILLTILFCSVFRAIGCIVLTEVANRFRLHKLNHVEKFVMSYGGLRGAVAFALVLLVDPNKVKKQPLFVTATISVVYFTVFFQGITIKPLVKYLKVKRANKFEKTMNERLHEKLVDYTMAGMEDILGHTGNLKIRDKFKQIDNKYIRPCLIREHAAHEPKILETYSKLTMRDAMDFMRRNATSSNLTGGNSESMAVLFRNYTANNLNGSASMAQMDNGWNLDIGELAYSPSARDLSDAKVHHMLSEELWKPYRRSSRRLSYSRHAVNDHDLSSSHHVNHNMHMHIRRMVSETVRKQHSKRVKRHRDPHANGSGEGGSRNGTKSVSFKPLKENGLEKKLHDDYLHAVIKEVSEAEERNTSLDDVGAQAAGSSEDLDGDGAGITFIARKASIDPVLYSYESAMAELINNQQMALAGLLAASALAHLPVQPELSPIRSPDLPQSSETPRGKRLEVDGKGAIKKSPAAPSRQIPSKSKPILGYAEPATGIPSAVLEQARLQQHRLRFLLERQRQSLKRVISLGEAHPSTPTAAEMQLPWKRDDADDMSTFAIKQSEFPLWVDNKEYNNYYSPTNTFLGELDKKKSQHPSVIDIFTREHRTADLSERGENTLSPPTSFDVTVTIPEEISKEDEEAEANQKTFTK
ncbi:sodium/hydrogen exchanger 3-like isoform X1 [Daphnia pulex]|uniref:sodium/hydrogen exchanger 3-like isoform X1 n=1 Tax=Daphnia pulex TaxID=6669 RepID=UPI001EDDA051|nr:sodium/hydrogen exchanger 3-like isoform X1 [Daphnia pulex]XP_046455206.1 sodium/hydrogen exchanger 3-like isoform X1 [Daphnia pulex]